MSTQLDGAAAPSNVEVDSRLKSIDIDQDDLEAEKLGITPPYMQDAFGDEESADVKYKVLKWWYVLGADCYARVPCANVDLLSRQCGLRM